MTKWTAAGCVVLAAVSAAAPAFAKPVAMAADMGIAAVVGTEAISSYDVDNRLKFVIASSRLPDTQEVAEHIRPQIIRALIDERLQLQDATKNGVTVTDDEIKAAITEIEAGRNMPPGAIFAMLKNNRIPKDTFTEQIRTQLAWRKLVLKKIRPLVRISDEEADLASAIPTSAGTPQEFRIAVLTLPVDKPANEKTVERTSQNLAKELRAGASFEEVTRQFSGQSRSGADESFWVRPDQLDPIIARSLATANVGTITDPVRTGAGYTVVKVYETRSLTAAPVKDSEVEIKEVVLKLAPGAPKEEADALLAIGEALAEHPGTCEEKGVASIGDMEGLDIDVNLRRERMSALPAGIRTIVEGLKVGQMSTPFASGEGIRLYMLCGKEEKATAPAVDKERVKNQLYQQKIELEAQKYLRNLRREAFIEVR